ncbi:nitric oxide dioxygenase [Plantibacter flavus]|uniref:nitric oxide dioxygenase n=1 Tax=Plantibacter flavus TaxID=150123 RepID=A0A3N2C862_9MICO|nr:globin domain-containing protein [Plantibacter flavus]ROR83695.1 nitric oxide dioxygenase [Plantibacter flavus]SMG26392.1 nitric oxide dioxygenase [Plantibacter flavus]
MLTEATRTIIAETAPVIAGRMETITTSFYAALFADHPGLLDGMFSRTNHATGQQAAVLAASIVAFATAASTSEEAPAHLVTRIAHRHASLGVTPEQYQVVYEYLFRAIATDLGDAATSEVVAAWSEVYWLFADVLIAAERRLYGAQANDSHWTPWTVSEKIVTTSTVTEFIFVPADGTPVTPAVAGNYVSLRVTAPDGSSQARAFTLLRPGTGRSIAVKRDPDGDVTPVLHDVIEVGDVIELSNPYGAVVLDDDRSPLVLISAGIGCTPTVSYLEALVATADPRTVLVLHADRSREDFAFADRIASLVDRLPDARMQTWFADDVAAPRLELDHVALPEHATLSICGPLGFMQVLRDTARSLGIPEGRLRYEIFGPDVWLATGRQR